MLHNAKEESDYLEVINIIFHPDCIDYTWLSKEFLQTFYTNFFTNLAKLNIQKFPSDSLIDYIKSTIWLKKSETKN